MLGSDLEVILRGYVESLSQGQDADTSRILNALVELIRQ